MLSVLLAASEAEPACRFRPEPYAAAGTVYCANGLVIGADSALAALDSVRSGQVLLASLRAPVDSAALAELRQAGFEPLAGIWPQAVVLRAKLKPAGPLPTCLLWLAPLPAAAKLAPDLPAEGESELVAAVWPGVNPESLRCGLLALGAAVRGCGQRTIEFDGSQTVARAVAGLDGIAWIQPRANAQPLNDQVQWVLQVGWFPEEPLPETARPIWQRGIRGQGIVAGIFDSGLYTEHNMFRDDQLAITRPGIYPEHRKVVAYKLYRNAHFGDNSGIGYHGSAVAGCLAGDDSAVGGASRLDGIAPESRLYLVDNGTAYGTYVFDPDMTELLDSARLSLGMTEPVKLASGSFGSGIALGYYRLEEATVDAVLWQDKWFTLIWAAGNFGRGTYNIAHPAGAKSVLTVGATGNGIAANQTATFSSRGPMRDGRIKPEVVSPGEGVWTVYGDSSASFRVRNGTSFAAPGVAGALALAKQYLRDGWYPLGRPEPGNAWPRVTSALLRALAVAGADPNAGSGYVPSPDFGWGRFNLGRVLRFEGDSIALGLFEDTVGISTGEYREYSFQLAIRQPLRVVLAWTDTAAPPFPAAAIVNDIDLELVGPDGSCYRGNQIFYGQSVPSPAGRDECNTIEVCVLDVPLAGRWIVRVLGRSVYTPRQPYAVAVRSGPAPLSEVRETRSVQLPGRVGSAGVSRLEFFGPGRLTVFSSDGRVVAAAALGPGHQHWQGTGLPAGVYVVRYRSAAAATETKRLLVIR